MTVKRYDAHTNNNDFKSDWHEKKDGPMVRYDDYAALLKERDALAAENTGLNKFIDDECYVYGPYDVEPVDAALEKPEIPATDAAIAEIQARGVEMFADSLRAVGGHAHPYSVVAIEFAAQLRKEAGNV